MTTDAPGDMIRMQNPNQAKRSHNDGVYYQSTFGIEIVTSSGYIVYAVPVVVVDHHGDESADVYGTITHNRARGTHLLDPMKAIVKKLMDEGKTVDEIGKQLGMKPEEIFRLSGFTKDEFLNMMTKDHPTYSKAKVIRSI